MSIGCLAPERRAASTPYVETPEIEHLDPGDATTVLEVFAGLGPRSRELRFLTAKPRLTSADLRQLTAVDQLDHVALLARSPREGRPIGVARFVRDPVDPQSADVAVAVVDAWQNRGVGTLLAEALVQQARELDVRRFTLVMSRDNEAAARLMHRVQGEVERLEIDVETAEFAVNLDAAPSSLPRQPSTLKGARR